LAERKEEGKRRGVLGLARVPKDLEEAKGLGRGEERRGVIDQAITERCTHTGHCNIPVTLTGG